MAAPAHTTPDTIFFATGNKKKLEEVGFELAVVHLTPAC